MFDQFVQPGAVVFDIGANEGKLTRAFLNLGAVVIAVEPQARFAEYLEQLTLGRGFFVQAAVGAQLVDEVVLKTSSRFPHLSTLSARWIERSPDSPTVWDGEEKVPQVTVDSLVERYGEPDFVKIDTEGYDVHVLAGLSYPLAGLCFEVHSALRTDAMMCLRRLGQLGRYEFMLIDGETGQSIEDWTREGFDFLDRLPTWGDVFARRIG